VASDSSVASIRAALRASGAIRETSAASYSRIAELYRSPALSRTAAFVDAISKSTREALRLIEAVRRMRVAIVGCGGIGSGAAFLLASMGISELVLIDADRVELSNLNRQFLYTRKSIGKFKALELKRALYERFEHTLISAVPTCYPSDAAKHALSRVSLAICVGDSPPNLFAQLEKAMVSGQQLWSAGYLMGLSTVRRHGGSDRGKDVKWLTRQDYFAPSVGFQNMELAASLVARIALCGHNRSKGRDRAWTTGDYRQLLKQSDAARRRPS
jgi:hypothetical protein